MPFFIIIFLFFIKIQAEELDTSQSSFISSALSSLNFFNNNGNCKLVTPTQVPPRPMMPTKDFSTFKDAPEIIRQASNSVHSICFCKNSPSNCATFTSLGKGIFVTNEHVLEDLLSEKNSLEKLKNKKCDWLVAGPNDTSKKIQFNIQKRGWWNHHNPKYDDQDHTKDLAYIEIPELSYVAGLKESRSTIQLGESVFVMGFPMQNPNIIYDRKSMKPTLSEGIITSVTISNISADFIGVNGMSGGPVLNTRGELVGIFWGKEHNERDDPFYGDNPNRPDGLPSMMPRETSYFIPSSYVLTAKPKNFLDRLMGIDQ